MEQLQPLSDPEQNETLEKNKYILTNVWEKTNIYTSNTDNIGAIVQLIWYINWRRKKWSYAKSTSATCIMSRQSNLQKFYHKHV